MMASRYPRSSRISLTLSLTLGVLVMSLLGSAPAMAQHGDSAFLGISSRSLSGEEARDAGLPSRDGALLETVYEGTAADRAGLREGDILLKFGNQKIYDDRDLTDMIHRRQPGDAVAITLVRNDEEMTVNTKLGSRRDFDSSKGPTDGWSRFWDGVGEIFGHDSGDGPRLGVHVEELGEQMADYFGVDKRGGILLTHIVADSPAEEANLMAGDVVVSIDGSKIRRSGDISRALRGKFGETVEVTVVRRGERTGISVMLEDE